MKKIIFTSIMLSSLLLTACGDSKSASYSSTNSYNAVAESPQYEYSDSEENYEDDTENKADLQNSDKKDNTSEDIIKKEMLVYSCNMTIDVLDFDDYISSLRNNINTYSAFVENENYSDGGYSSRWQYSDSEKWQSYTATIRVPSSNYDSFCDTVSQLGDLRSKNASVQNMSREYYDLSATLDIYEAKEMRYMELLSTIKDKQYAISVEKELTEIQIEISKIKTRMNDIQTDVAYSYVYITVNEVKEYTEEPVKTDTFFQRLSNTVSDAASSFLNIMEKLLFIFIYLFPHLIIIGLIVFIISRICKTVKKRKIAKLSAESTPMPVADVKAEENNTPKE